MHMFILKVELSWYLKQEQLVELNSILHHENYTDTGLAKGNDSVEDLCAGLNEYIIKANETAQDERTELDLHIKIVEDLKTKMENEPCPCEWDNWSQWSDCKTTCGLETTQRVRSVKKAAVNGGLECQGDNREQKNCNEITCCREF